MSGEANQSFWNINFETIILLIVAIIALFQERLRIW